MPPSLPISTPQFRPPGTKNPWPQRIGLFSLGLAIGLLLLGSIQMGKRNAARKAQQQQQQPSPTQNGATSPGAPPQAPVPPGR
jgi:hypothetical protein